MNETPPPNHNGFHVRPARQPMFNVPPVTLWAAGAITAVFAFIQVAPSDWANWIVFHFALLPERLVLAWADPLGPYAFFGFGGLLLHTLVHVDWAHWALNTGFLVAFGAVCERVFGPRRYILLLLVATLAGSAAQLIAEWGTDFIMFGASGAVAGCFAGACRLMIGSPDPRRRRTGWSLLIFLVGTNILFAVVGGAIFGVSGSIAWQAHLGGFVGGWLMAYPRVRFRPR
ncbi:MAG: rhomboid family intramembrane serine protease [Pseudomonadota bacterium]